MGLDLVERGGQCLAAQAPPPGDHAAADARPLATLLEAADKHDLEFGAVLRVLVATGARRGEVCGLRWSDIDLPGSTVTIRRSVASVAGGTVVKETKTHAARRIAVDAETLDALARRRERAAAAGRSVRGSTSTRRLRVHVVGRTDRSRCIPTRSPAGFRRLCQRAGLDGVRLHDLRHLHATQLLAAGVPVRTVSGRLGHANAATTLNVYAHFLEASDRQAADVIAGLLDTPSPMRSRRSAKEIAWPRPPTDDDVPITLDGRRLDTPEKVIAFLREINEQRAAEDQRDG